MDKIRILLVDDSIPFLRAATDFLAADEDLAVVGTARDGNEALCQAVSLHPDVVVLDVHMPGLNGIEITPRLCEILPEAAIILVSIQNSEVYKEAAVTAGADDFIPKEGLVNKLIPAIHRVTSRDEKLVHVE
jgi:DNA-binding NarL/FixJ family response regulator